MKITIYGKQMSVRESLKAQIEKKLTKFDKFFGKETEAFVTCKTRKGAKILEITVNYGSTTFRSEEESDTFILCGDDFSDVIDSSAFLSEYVLGDNIEGIDYCYKEFENVTQLSEKEFMSASESHFALESIYTAAMNFGIIKDIEDKLREDIYFYLK